MRREDVGASYLANPAIRREYDYGGERRLQRTIEVREALDVEHVDLVDEEHARHELGHALIDVPIHHAVDFRPQLLGDFGLLRLTHRGHQRHDVLPPLRTRVGHVEVVERDVLHDLLLLVHVALRQRHVLLGLEVEFGRVGVAPAHALHGSGIGLDVHDVADAHPLLRESLVYRRIELQRLAPLRGFERDDHVGDGPAVPAQRVLRLLDGQFGHLALVHLLRLTYAQADGASEVLHQYFRLLYLRAEDLGPHHGTEWDLRPKLLHHSSFHIFHGDFRFRLFVSESFRTRMNICMNIWISNWKRNNENPSFFSPLT